MWIPQGHRSSQKTCSSMGSSPWAAAPARSLLLHGLSTDCTSSRHIPLPGRGVAHGLQCGYSALQEGNVLLHWLQGISALAPGVLPAFSFTYLGICSLFFPHFFVTPLFHSCCALFPTLSSIYYHRGTTRVVDGLSFGQCWVCLGASWNRLCPTWRQLLLSSYRNHPISHPTAKPWPHKPHAQAEH